MNIVREKNEGLLTWLTGGKLCREKIRKLRKTFSFVCRIADVTSE